MAKKRKKLVPGVIPNGPPPPLPPLPSKKKKITKKNKKKSATEGGWLKVNPDRPFPPPPKPKKRKNRTLTRNDVLKLKARNEKKEQSVIFKCVICNSPIQVGSENINFCAKCTRGWFGKLGMWFVDLFVVFKSFILGK